MTTYTNHSKRLTIFEGPDGAGKTTAAKRYAELSGARYVHFGPMKNVKDGLARIYVEGMLPALLGYQDVVFDRCWLSEAPYGQAFRDGANRIGRVYERMLERIAMRCGAVVVRCLPEWPTVRENFLRRSRDEYLKNEEQLLHVWDYYSWMTSSLPIIEYDYEHSQTIDEEMLDHYRGIRHCLTTQSAGFFGATNIIVGESFAEIKNQDTFNQYPFVSFSGSGCSSWLTAQLEKIGVAEDDLLFVNSDQPDLEVLINHSVEITNGIDGGPRARVIVLGNTAEERLSAAFDKSWLLDHTGFVKIPHPQSWLRFNGKHEYKPLRQALWRM